MIAADDDIRKVMRETFDPGVDVDAAWSTVNRRGVGARRRRRSVAGLAVALVVSAGAAAVTMNADDPSTTIAAEGSDPPSGATGAPGSIGGLLEEGMVRQSSAGTSNVIEVKALDGRTITLDFDDRALPDVHRSQVHLRASVSCADGCGSSELSAEFGHTDGGEEIARYERSDGSIVRLLEEHGQRTLALRTDSWTIRATTSNIEDGALERWADLLRVREANRWPVLESSPDLVATSGDTAGAFGAIELASDDGIFSVDPKRCSSDVVASPADVPLSDGSSYFYATKCSIDGSATVHIQGLERFADVTFEDLDVRF